MNNLREEDFKYQLNDFELQIKWEEDKLKYKREWFKERNKMNKSILITCGVMLLVLCTITSIPNLMPLNGFNAFSICLLTVTAHSQLRDWTSTSLEMKTKIKTLELKIVRLKEKKKLLEEQWEKERNLRAN